MRKVAFAAALMLLSSASAAVVAVETGIPSPTAIELPGSKQLAHAQDSTSTIYTTSTSIVWDTVTVWLSTSSTNISSTISSTPSVTSSTSSTTSSLTETNIVHHGDFAASDANATQTTVETIMVTVIAQPVVTDYIDLADAKGWLPHNLNRLGTPSKESIQAEVHNPNVVHRPDDFEAGRTMRDAVYERDTIIASNLVTQFTTSIIPASTMYVQVTCSPPPPATGTTLSTLAYAMPASLSVPFGVLITSVTSVVTITSVPIGPSQAAGPTHTSPIGTASTSTCTNETASFTESWLNISTFVATGPATWTEWTTWPVGSSSAATNSTTGYAGTTTTSVRFPTSTTRTPQTTDENLPGFSGAQTASFQHNGASKMVDVGGLPIPIAMIVAMAACLALALLL